MLDKISLRITNGIDWHYRFAVASPDCIARHVTIAFRRYRAEHAQQILAFERWRNENLREINAWYKACLSRSRSDKTGVECEYHSLLSRLNRGFRHGKQQITPFPRNPPMEIHIQGVSPEEWLNPTPDAVSPPTIDNEMTIRGIVTSMDDLYRRCRTMSDYIQSIHGLVDFVVSAGDEAHTRKSQFRIIDGGAQ